MGNIFYLIGIALAGYAGCNNLQWYFIFISSLIIAIGYFIIRAPQIHNIVSENGAIALPRMLLTVVVLNSIITALVYFIATLLN
jgi:hypothetical protein